MLHDALSKVIADNFRYAALPAKKVVADNLRYAKALPAFDGLVVAIERTDWSRGRGDDRAAWVREARARGALGIGFATACCAAMKFGIKPHIVGVREWMGKIGSANKADTASLVRYMFPDLFVVKQTALAGDAQNPSSRRRGAAAMHDRKTDRQVPSHVLDAIALAVVVQRQIEFEKRIAR